MSAQTILLTQARKHTREAMRAMQKMQETDEFDYDGHGKVSAAQLCHNMLEMAFDDMGRMLEIARRVTK